MVKPKRVPTEAEIQESLRFADGGMAAAGHFVTNREVRNDAELMLRGVITVEEAIERAATRTLASAARRTAAVEMADSIAWDQGLSGKNITDEAHNRLVEQILERRESED